MNPGLSKELAPRLAGQTVLVTGSTGLIGRHLVRRLLEWNRRFALDLRVVAAVRSVEKAEKVFGADVSALQLASGDIRCLRLDGLNVDYAIHAASNTSSQAFVEAPADIISEVLGGTRHLLEAVKAIPGFKRFVFLSTMEVYGTPQTDESIAETHVGAIDPLSVRSCYPLSKKLAENLCVAYGAQYGVPACIVRLTQTFGEGVDYADGRVFAEFARCAIEGRDIVLATPGKTRRSYLYVGDAVDAILTVMLLGKTGTAYNAANEETYCSIREMADMVAACFGNGRVEVRVDERPLARYAPTLHMNLDTAKLGALGWRAEIGLEEMFRRLIASMRLQRKE